VLTAESHVAGARRLAIVRNEALGVVDLSFIEWTVRSAQSWRSVVAWPFLVQSPLAICAALTMQRSLGGRPHRSDRSQSPQVNSRGCRSATTALANLAKTSWIAIRMAVLLDNQFIGHKEPRRFDKYQFGVQTLP